MGSVTRVGPDSEDTTFHRSVVTTRMDQLANWARSGSLWPLPFGTACCAIEFMSVVSAHYDLSRFGAEVVRFSPRQSDVIIVAGTVTDKQAPILKQIWEQMAEPKWSIAMGVCASSGGFYRAYHVTQGIDEIIPVDVYVPGCPPTPEGLIYAVMELQRKIQGERRISGGGVGGRRITEGQVAGFDSIPRVQREEADVLAGAAILNSPGALSDAIEGDPKDWEGRGLRTVERVNPPPEDERVGSAPRPRDVLGGLDLANGNGGAAPHRKRESE